MTHLPPRERWRGTSRHAITLVDVTCEALHKLPLSVTVSDGCEIVLKGSGSDSSAVLRILKCRTALQASYSVSH